MGFSSYEITGLGIASSLPIHLPEKFSFEKLHSLLMHYVVGNHNLMDGINGTSLSNGCDKFPLGNWTYTYKFIELGKIWRLIPLLCNDPAYIFIDLGHIYC